MDDIPRRSCSFCWPLGFLGATRSLPFFDDEVMSIGIEHHARQGRRNGETSARLSWIQSARRAAAQISSAPPAGHNAPEVCSLKSVQRGGAGCHHPNRAFTRVIIRGLLNCAATRPRHSPASGQSSYHSPSSPARLTAAVLLSTPSLRYTARWWVLTVLSETYSCSPISRRDNPVARSRRTSSSFRVSSSPPEASSLRGVNATLVLSSAPASSSCDGSGSSWPRSRVLASFRPAPVNCNIARNRDPDPRTGHWCSMLMTIGAGGELLLAVMVWVLSVDFPAGSAQANRPVTDPRATLSAQ
jgi:hypothetical protein